MQLDADVEREWLIPGRAHFDVVRARRQIQMLKMSVEIVDDPGVIAVDEHLRMCRLNLQPQSARGPLRVERVRRVPLRRNPRIRPGPAGRERTSRSIARPERIVVQPEAPEPERATEVRP